MARSRSVEVEQFEDIVSGNTISIGTISEVKEQDEVPEDDQDAVAKSDDLWCEVHRGLMMMSSIMFLPFFIFVGLGYGLRAGLLVGVKKAIELFENWGS